MAEKPLSVKKSLKNCISCQIILKGLESNPIYQPSDE